MILALLLNGLFFVPGVAQTLDEADLGSDCEPAETIRFRGGTARLENDVFAGTDQNYSNGLALTLVSRDISGRLRSECLPAPVRLHAKFIKFVNPGFWADADSPGSTQNVVVRFGQSVYTPEDYTKTDLIADDRP